MKKLTIAILTLPNRVEQFTNLLNELTRQIEFWNLSEAVEILYLGDNKSLTVGAKRDALLNMATGSNIAFIDDDDEIHNTYLHELIKAIRLNPTADVYTFNVEITQNGKDPKPVYYSIEFLKDQNFKDHYKRIPNHLSAVKTVLAQSVGYKALNFQEDADYSKRLLPLLKNEVIIDETLYYYLSNWQTSETLPKHLKEQLLKTIK